MVETEIEEDDDEADRILFEVEGASASSLWRSRFLPLSCSSLARCSSAMPFLQNISALTFTSSKVWLHLADWKSVKS